jgi:hypothetical protein
MSYARRTRRPDHGKVVKSVLATVRRIVWPVFFRRRRMSLQSSKAQTHGCPARVAARAAVQLLVTRSGAAGSAATARAPAGM